MESRFCFLLPARVCRVLMMKLCFRSLFRRWLVPVSKFWGFDAFICRHQLTHSEDVWVDYIPAVFVRFCSAVTALLSCEQQQRQAVVCQHFRTPGITSCPVIVITAVGGSYSKPYWLSFRVNTELLAFNKKPHQVVSWPLTHSCILRHSHIETERQTDYLSQETFQSCPSGPVKCSTQELVLELCVMGKKRTLFMGE